MPGVTRADAPVFDYWGNMSKVIYKRLLVIILLACSSYVAGAAHSEPQKPARRTVVVDVPERTQKAFILKSDMNRVMTPLEWKKLALALEEVKKLKVGMTRGDVLKDFFLYQTKFTISETGGTSSKLTRI